MTAALLGTVLTASLAGSLHCAGMCGGFVAFYAGRDASGRGARWTGHAAYNGGRLASYLLLGALAGALGAAVDLAGSMAGLQQVAALAAGALMVVWGVYALLQALDLPVPAIPVPRIVHRVTSRAYDSMRERPPVFRALLLGLFSTLLPCGWLYAFAILAAGTGSPWLAMTVMAAFWIGSVPVMLGLGVSLQWLSVPLRRRLPAVTAAVLIVVGLLWLIGRSTMTANEAQHHPEIGVAAVDTVGDADRDPHAGH
jgi:sulfite exporter TauE/SafE